MRWTGRTISCNGRAVGRAPRRRVMGAGLLKIAGLFHADAREVLEMPYLRETPVLLDDSKLPAQLGGLHKAFLWRGHPADARVDAGAAR